ncbi:DUF1585 domain-containing protein, partial [Ralstonia sp.]|uniref:DUF1585 domain-containing protein n=1 Tax=Ralstonia sp. TaxID=54061 RepID=UPI001A3E6800
KEDVVQKRGRKKQRQVGGIDTSGQLPTGEEFENFAELKKILVETKRETIIRNIVIQTLSYALCRKLEVYDQPTVETMVKELTDTNGTYRDLVHMIVNSLPFRKTFVIKESS